MLILRKSLLLLFCLRLLLPGQTVAELFKLPFLVSHYLHHHHTEEHSHIFGFLMEHYGADDHHEQDEAEHKAHHQLPFGSHHTDGLKEPVQPFLTVAALKYPRIEWPTLPDNPLICLVKEWYSQYYPSIWQPPKIG